MGSLAVRLPQLPEHVLQPYPHDPNARSYIGGTSTTIYFVNELPIGFSAQIYSIGYQGERIPWDNSAKLLKSQYFQATAYIHQPWEVVFLSQRETVIKIYHPEPNPSRIMLNTSVFSIPRLAGQPPSLQRLYSLQDARSTTIIFVNYLKIKVSIRWVNFNGNRTPYATILPGSSSSQSTYVGHIWEVVTADFEKRPIALFYAAPYDALAEINDELFLE